MSMRMSHSLPGHLVLHLIWGLLSSLLPYTRGTGKQAHASHKEISDVMVHL
jgi:hypothetical protein